MKRRTRFNIHPKIIKELKNKEEGINAWIQKEAPKYQDLPLKPIQNYNKQTYAPLLTLTTLEALNTIPGKTNSNKLTHLYMDYKRRQEKRKNREKILQHYFKQ